MMFYIARWSQQYQEFPVNQPFPVVSIFDFMKGSEEILERFEGLKPFIIFRNWF